MVGPVSLSLIGPIYIAYQHDPYVAVLFYSFLCTCFYIAWTWQSVRHAYTLLGFRLN